MHSLSASIDYIFAAFVQDAVAFGVGLGEKELLRNAWQEMKSLPWENQGYDSRKETLEADETVVHLSVIWYSVSNHQHFNT